MEPGEQKLRRPGIGISGGKLTAKLMQTYLPQELIAQSAKYSTSIGLLFGFINIVSLVAAKLWRSSQADILSTNDTYSSISVSSHSDSERKCAAPKIKNSFLGNGRGGQANADIILAPADSQRRYAYVAAASVGNSRRYQTMGVHSRRSQSI